jgi:hypothetical protein
MRTVMLVVSVFVACVTGSRAVAQDKSDDRSFSVGEGKLTFAVPDGWTKKQPQTRIVEAELATPAAKAGGADAAGGRMTAMGAGGSLQANIDRWVGQFAGEGGAAVTPKLDKLNVNGCEVQIVDLSGTYKDTPGGPFAGGKTVNRDNYRMLAAIVQTKDAGYYFLKLYGPKTAIDEAEKGFFEMIKSLKLK